jgi:hypothetical protein
MENIQTKKNQLKKDQPKKKRSIREKKRSSAFNYGKSTNWKTKTNKRAKLLDELENLKNLEIEKEKDKAELIQEIYERHQMKGIVSECEVKSPKIISGEVKYINKMDPHVIESLETLIEMSFVQMDPSLNGLDTLEPIRVVVDDEKMSSLIIGLTESGIWETINQTETRGVGINKKERKIRKWRTDDREHLERFFLSFLKCKQKSLIERHFIHSCGSFSDAVQVDKRFINCITFLRFEGLAELYGLKSKGPFKISSCEMILGGFDRKKKKKGGYFTIEYIEGVFDNLKKGYLSFHFRYDNFLNGRKTSFDPNL